MYAKKPRFRLWLLILVAALVVGVTIGTAVGKYIKTTEFKGTLEITADLVDTFTLQESKANRQSDGSYKLDTGTSVKNNTYTLIPGLDIPKDPYIKITGKTPIAAYLFVEVVDSSNLATEGITYTLTSGWTELSEVAGKHGGKVYVYKDTLTGTPANFDRISILADDTVYVSQKLDKSVTGLKLDFYAAMGEVGAQDGSATPRDAATVYNDLKNHTHIK